MKLPHLGISRSGASLVEVVVAATILALGLSRTAMLEAHCLQLRRNARQTNVAVEMVQDELAQLLTQDKAVLASDTYTDGAYNGIDTVLEHQAVTFARPGYAVGDPIPDVLLVSLTIQWADASGQTRSYAIQGGAR